MATSPCNVTGNLVGFIHYLSRMIDVVSLVIVVYILTALSQYER